MKDYPFFHNATPNTFQNARALRADMTKAEVYLWTFIRKKQVEGLKFRRQHPVGSFIIDFYFHNIKLAVELDGAIHANPDQKAYDRSRDEEIKAMGINILRVTNAEVLNNVHSVLNNIRDIAKNEPFSTSVC